MNSSRDRAVEGAMRLPVVALFVVAAVGGAFLGCSSPSDDSAAVSDAGSDSAVDDAGTQPDAKARDAGKVDSGPPAVKCIGSVANGDFCSDGVDCCSGNCDDTSDTCCSDSKQACNYDADCCTGNRCGGSSCCALPGPKSYCKNGADCCADQACGTIYNTDSFGTGTPQENACCIKASNACETSDQCCAGPGSGGVQCYEGACCYSTGVACTKDAECCGAPCTDGLCE
ncbi:MAG: hypothetical protein ABI461_21295 [Polyangiaceae bacterium]